MKNSIKKLIAGVGAAAMLVSAMPIATAWYFDPEKAGDDYFLTEEIKDNDGNVVGLTISEYVGPATDEIIIPDEINGTAVKGVNNYAFSGIDYDVTIYAPDSLSADYLDSTSFLTAGVLNKGVISKSPVKSVKGVLKYWVEQAGVETDIDALADKAQDRIMDLVEANFDVNQLIKDAMPTGTDELLDLIDVDDLNSKLAEIEAIKTDINNMLNDDVVDFSTIDFTLTNDQIQDQIKDQINTNVTTKLKEIQTKLASLEELGADVKKISGKLDDFKKNLDTSKIADKVTVQITDTVTSVLNSVVTKGETLEDAIAAIECGDTAVETAIEIAKNVQAGKYDDNVPAKYKDRYNTYCDKLDTFLNSSVPYTGAGLEITAPYGSDVYNYANDKGIEVYAGEPTETTTAAPETVTQIVVSEVPGSTSIVELEGTTSIVEVPGSTVTSIVVSEVEKVSVSVSVSVTEVTVPGETVYVTVPGETVYVTEATTAKPSFLPGDANLNGKYDLYDAILIAEYLVHKTEFTDEQLTVADYTGKNNIDIYDAIGVAEECVKLMQSGKK